MRGVHRTLGLAEGRDSSDGALRRVFGTSAVERTGKLCVLSESLSIALSSSFEYANACSVH